MSLTQQMDETTSFRLGDGGSKVPALRRSGSTFVNQTYKKLCSLSFRLGRGFCPSSSHLGRGGSLTQSFLLKPSGGIYKRKDDETRLIHFAQAGGENQVYRARTTSYQEGGADKTADKQKRKPINQTRYALQLLESKTSHSLASLDSRTYQR